MQFLHHPTPPCIEFTNAKIYHFNKSSKIGKGVIAEEQQCCTPFLLTIQTYANQKKHARVAVED